jgi:hypothetical protein
MEDNGGHEIGSLDWLRYQASKIAYLHGRVSEAEASARLYLVIEAYKAHERA